LNLVDIVILVLVVVSCVAGLRTGAVRCVFSLLGLIIGIAFASRNYARFAHDWSPGIKSPALANAVWFCLLAIFVMLAAGLLGWLIRNAVELVGLGWLDSLLGLVFGFVQGAVLVTVCIVILALFYPESNWLADAALAKYFFNVTRLTTQITPGELKVKIQDGLAVLEKETPQLLHPK
jgi:membrane protein required for colicin V production